MKDLSLYIHVPFCKRRCSYCTFYHVPYIDRYETAFVDSLLTEFELTMRNANDVRIPSVFLGGGTPSVLTLSSLERILGAVAPWLATDAEITVENNPEDVTRELMQGFRRLGVNRISLGIQSMVPRALTVLKRCSPDVNAAAIDIVRDHYDNFSFDLVLGVPDGTESELEHTLEQLRGYDALHYSVYCLEPGGVMEREVEHFFDGVDPERSADEYLRVCDVMGQAGYGHYEVSNFARPGFESRHNRVYWRGGDYLGIGPAAHSYLGGERYYNEPSIERYVVAAGRPGRVREERDRQARELERRMLALRTSDGLSLEEVSCGTEVLDDIVADGLARVTDGRIVLTRRGFLVLNDILIRVTGV